MLASVSGFSCQREKHRAASNWPSRSSHPVLSRLTAPFLQSLQGHARRGTSSVSGRAELGAVGQLQAEMLHLDLIDGADGYRGDKESLKPPATAPPPVIKDPAAPVTMDTYRPKRPTTLNLFPIVPRTQVKPESTSHTRWFDHNQRKTMNFSRPETRIRWKDGNVCDVSGGCWTEQ